MSSSVGQEGGSNGNPSQDNPLVEEFLMNRTFRVEFCGHLSSEGIVKIRVPQGSVLRPLPFEVSIMTWQMNWPAIICSPQTMVSL